MRTEFVNICKLNSSVLSSHVNHETQKMRIYYILYTWLGGQRSLDLVYYYPCLLLEIEYTVCDRQYWQVRQDKTN